MSACAAAAPFPPHARAAPTTPHPTTRHPPSPFPPRPRALSYGLSKRFLDSKGVHVPERLGKSLTGTARYVSINAHRGVEQCRRDDLEALCYVLAYFLRGSLPWQGLRARDKATKYSLILAKKQACSAEALLAGFPTQLATLLTYARQLEYGEAPQYEKCAWLAQCSLFFPPMLLWPAS